MSWDSFRYEEVRGERLTGARVELDGNWFVDCHYEACDIVFRGDGPYGYTATEFDRCRIILEGRAQIVLSCLARQLADEEILRLVAMLRRTRPDVH